MIPFITPPTNSRFYYLFSSVMQWIWVYNYTNIKHFNVGGEGRRRGAAGIIWVWLGGAEAGEGRGSLVEITTAEGGGGKDGEGENNEIKEDQDGILLN